MVINQNDHQFCWCGSENIEHMTHLTIKQSVQLEF